MRTITENDQRGYTSESSLLIEEPIADYDVSRSIFREEVQDDYGTTQQTYALDAEYIPAEQVCRRKFCSTGSPTISSQVTGVYSKPS